MIQRTPRQRKCSAVHPSGMRCRNKFTPRNSGHVVCSPECAVIKGAADKAKKARKDASKQRQELREAKIKAKTRGDWIGEAQDAVNAFIRLRDQGEPCISCGKYKQKYQAGHYLARSIRPELRFHEDNIHAQCIYCNNFSKNAHHDYRENLIKKIGLKRVEWLEGQHDPAKHTIPELQEIKRRYSAMARELRPLK